MADAIIPPVVPPAAAWFGTDAEMVGFMQNRGWHDKPVNEVALAAIKSYQEAAKFVGAPPEQIIRVPKDANDAAGWAAVHQRLGAPADKAGYDFSTVKRADGTVPEAGYIDFLRETAASLNLPKERAVEFADKMLKRDAGVASETKAVRDAALAKSRADLKTDWGVNYDVHLQTAKNAAATLKMTPEDVAAFENQVGYDRVMKMLQSIGAKTGEDKFIRNDAPGDQGQLFTREQALARRTELEADRAWVKSYLGGDAAKRREMSGLQLIIAGPAS